MLEKRKLLITLYFFILFLVVGCQKDDNYIPLMSEEGEEFSGGETTIFDASHDAFGFKASNLEISRWPANENFINDFIDETDCMACNDHGKERAYRIYRGQ